MTETKIDALDDLMKQIDLKATLKVKLIECSILTDINDIEHGNK